MAEIYGREEHSTRTELTGAGVSSGEGGRRQKGVIIGRADTSAQEFSANTVQSLSLNSDIARYFGSVSPLGVELEAALYNGADRRDLRGVAPEEVSVTDEVVAGGSGTLTNAPIVESASDITVTTTDSATATTTEYSVNFVYETLPTAPAGDADTVNINPNTGEFEGPTTDDYTLSYRYLDWESALAAAHEVITVGDVGGIYLMAEADNLKTTLSEIVDEATDSEPAIRHDYRLGFGLAPAQPNATGPNGEAMIDPTAYSDTLDNDALFIGGGGRIDEQSAPTNAFDAPLATSTPGVPSTILGGMFGKMLGNQMTNPIYEDVVRGYGDISLVQAFSYDEAQALRDAQVIPMMDPSMVASGLPEIGDNHSTSTATDYVRDFHRLTIKDCVNLNFRNLAEAARSEILVTGPTGIIDETEQLGLDIFRQLAEQNVIVGAQEGSETPGTESALARTQPAQNAGTPAAGEGAATDQQLPYSVRVTQSDVDELVIEYEFTPTNVIKQVNNYGTVRDEVAVPLTGGGGGGTTT